MRAFLLKYLITVPMRISGHGEPKEGRRCLPVSTGFLATVILFKPEKSSRELGAIIVPLYSMWKVTGFGPDAANGDIIVAMAKSCFSNQTLLTTT